mgnify:CR=1 FL=1
MANKKYIPNIYGLGHSKFYTKSVVADFLIDRDDDGNVININSDVNLILRQKSIYRKVGVENLRDYVQNLMREDKTRDMRDFSDDELFQLIEPKSINTLTTAYEYAKYLQANSKQVKERYETIRKERDNYEIYVSKFRNLETSKDK